MFGKLVRWIRSFFVLVWLLAILLIGGWIAYGNPDYTSLNVFGFQFPEMTIGFYLCFTFTAGVALGWFGTWLLAQAKLYSRRRELGKVNKEVGKLRAAQVKE
ncbi:LapA family protein [Teredinibacter haidensis]|uniref:LapA family protein n=1 Tax=Teredinibacter haidensis TaxID=2731755 RepID=UPI000948A93B|nr:LapA family protein [Teredinibacter haidensis]